MKRFFTLFYILNFLYLFSFAQSEKIFTGDRELSSSLVNQVFQDSKGYIWIATEDGLNFYDGSRFFVYKHIKNDPSSIKNNSITYIFGDKKGSLYFGYINGIQRYNYITDKFENIPLIRQNHEQKDARVFCILERENGDILIGTSGYGIFILKKGRKKLFILQNFTSR